MILFLLAASHCPLPISPITERNRGRSTLWGRGPKSGDSATSPLEVGKSIGSLAGGGRYDKLIKQLGSPDLPATGIAFGLERIIEVLREQLPASNFQLPTSKILLCPLYADALPTALELSQKLRRTKKVVEVYLDTNTEGSLISKLEKQLKYADRKGFAYAIIIGEQEVKEKMLTLKNLKNGEQKKLSADEIVKFYTSN